MTPQRRAATVTGAPVFIETDTEPAARVEMVLAPALLPVEEIAGRNHRRRMHGPAIENGVVGAAAFRQSSHGSRKSMVDVGRFDDGAARSRSRYAIGLPLKPVEPPNTSKAEAMLAICHPD